MNGMPMDPMMAGEPPPGPDMGMPPEAMAPEVSEVPPGPDELLGSAPMQPAITVPGWIPADPNTPIDDMTCGQIGAIPYPGKDGKPFCLIAPPDEMVPPPPGV